MRVGLQLRRLLPGRSNLPIPALLVATIGLSVILNRKWLASQAQHSAQLGASVESAFLPSTAASAIYEKFKTKSPGNISTETTLPQNVTGGSNNTGAGTPSNSPSHMLPAASIPQLKPLKKLLQVDDGIIVGDVSDLLDFAIIGFAKCGTTALASWIDMHPETDVLPDESFALTRKQPGKLVHWLWERRRNAISVLSNSTNILKQRQLPKLGYKQPKDILLPHVIEAFSEHFDKTKLIVTLRHPIDWFESYWNFRNWRKRNQRIAMDRVTGQRQESLQKKRPNFPLHTGLGQFHVFLSMLGKTPQLKGSEEWSLIEPFLIEDETSLFPFQRLPNPLFLVELSQLSDTNDTRRVELGRDLSRFLNVSESAMPKAPPHVRPEEQKQQEKQLNIRKRNRESICKSEYEPLRKELLHIGDLASKWINVFLRSKDNTEVVVSSPDYFRQLVASWSIDPCVTRHA